MYTDTLNTRFVIVTATFATPEEAAGVASRYKYDHYGHVVSPGRPVSVDMAGVIMGILIDEGAVSFRCVPADMPQKG